MESLGKLIALYGVNNLGKSTQAELLVARMRAAGRGVEYLKYPLYDLEPTGSAINACLRGGNPEGWSPTDLQNAMTMNRLAYDSTLRKTLEGGTFVVCEDYRGTGLAWGIAAGVDEKRLRKINEPLADEDVVVLLDGERFVTGRETGHRHEDDDKLIVKTREVFLRLADEFGWHIVNANRPREEVHGDVWAVVELVL